MLYNRWSFDHIFTKINATSTGSNMNTVFKLIIHLHNVIKIIFDSDSHSIVYMI